MSSFDSQRLGQIMEPEPSYRIDVARLIVPEYLPSGAPADSDGPKTGEPAGDSQLEMGYNP